MKITITGASGFVGSNLTEYLKGTYCLNGMSARYIANQRFEINADVIIHLAGKAHDLKKVSSPQDYYDANFELTKQLFDAFLNSETFVFVFMSTVKAVADEVDGILTEDTVANPTTHYGIAKHQAEEYILSQELPEGKKVYILRPCMIHGPGNKGNLNLLYQLVSKGLPWPLGDFQNRRSFLSIENLCFVMKELLEDTTIPSGVYNAADDDALSTNDLIQLLGTSLGKPTKIWNWSQNVMRSLAKVGDVLPSPLNSERLQKLTESYVVSNHKIVKAIVKSLPISAEDGLTKTFKSFRK
jgi:nucleoside-diphosphate-sugar epimerase